METIIIHFYVNDNTYGYNDDKDWFRLHKYHIVTAHMLLVIFEQYFPGLVIHNSLKPFGAICRHETGSTLVKVCRQFGTKPSPETVPEPMLIYCRLNEQQFVGPNVNEQTQM